MARFRMIIAAATCAIALLAAATVAAQTTETVKLAGDKFKPGSVTIKQGDTLKLKWKSGKHDVEFSGSSNVEDVGVKSSGSAKRTFNTAGTFQMVCTIHGGELGSSGGMTAKVEVK